jgi:peptidoglycan/LPS O-acetylase OafA/YrhL
METKKKVESLSFLRGLAVVLVCFCHFGTPFADNNPLEGMFHAFHEYGKYGVQVFFVISGFIIPLSMDKAKYQLKYYGKFLLKRAIRLHPPYLAALVITLIVVGLANKVKHEPFPENTWTIFQSLFYIHAPANNPVFWTLKIEAEYYLLMGLIFTVLQKFPKPSIIIGVPALMLISQTSVIAYIELFEHMLFFMIGIIGYMIFVKKEGSNWLELGGIAAITVFCYIYYGISPTIAAVFTIAVILLYKGKVAKPIDFMGEISYSVYLLHFPIGVKFLNLFSRYVPPAYSILLFAAACALVFVIGVVFWKYVEKPFGDMSNRIRYGESKRAPQPLTVEAAN